MAYQAPTGLGAPPWYGKGPNPNPAPQQPYYGHPPVPADQQVISPWQEGITRDGKVATWSTKQKQATLAKLGYNVTQDGILGPQTDTAWKAYQKAIPASYWNKIWAKNHAPAPTVPQISLPGGAAPGGSPLPTADYTPPPGSGHTGKGGATPPNPYQAYLDEMSHIIDPTSYAKSATDAVYNPQINALVRQQVTDKAQQGQDQSDISSWYKTLSDQINAAHTSDQAAYQGLLGSEAGVSKGVVDSLGGSASPAAADAGAQSQIGANLLAALSQASQSGLNARGIAAGQAGVGQHLLSRRNYDASKLDTAGKLADMRSAAGSEYNKNLQDAYGLQGAQAKNLLNSTVVANEAAQTAKGRDLANQATAQGIKIDNWRWQMGIKAANASGQATIPAFDKQDPTKLTNFLLSGTLGPKGNFNQNPADVLQKMTALIKTVSYGNYDPATDPKVASFVNGLVQAHLAAWNRQNPQNRFTYKGGRLVHTK